MDLLSQLIIQAGNPGVLQNLGLPQRAPLEEAWDIGRYVDVDRTVDTEVDIDMVL